MIWVPILLGTFKLVVFGTGMFFAIKWHYDQGKKKKNALKGPPAPAERPLSTPDQQERR